MDIPETKAERKKYFRKIFYEKWGNYQNYLNHKPEKIKKPRRKIYLKITQRTCDACGNIAETIGIFKKKRILGYTGIQCGNCGLKELAEYPNQYIKLKLAKFQNLWSGRNYQKSSCPNQ